MLNIFRESMIYQVIFRCLTYFEHIYQNSVLAAIIRHSFIGRIPRYYEEKEPLFLSSFFVKLLKVIAGFFKKIVDLIMRPVWNGKLAFVKEAKVFHIPYEILVYLIALFGFADFVFRQYFSGLSSVWDELFLILLVCVWVYKWMTEKDAEAYKMSPFDMSILIFIGIMVLEMFVSARFNIAFEGFRAIVQSMFWYFVAFQLLKSEKTIKYLVTVFVGGTGLLGIHGIYQYIIGVEMPSTWVQSSEVGIRTRVFSIFTSPNIFGSLLVLAIPMCVALFFVSNKVWQKILFLGLAGCMGGALLFTYSRGAWIGAVFAAGVYVLMKDKRLIIPAVIAGVLIFICVPSISERLLFMLSPEYMAASMRGGRLIRWITGLQILQEHPMFGLGLGGFGGAVAAHHDLQAVVRGSVVDTFYMDNYYMKIAAEAGLLGIAAFVFLMWQVFSVSVKTVHITKNKQVKEIGIGITAGLTGVIIHCFVENIFEVPMMGVLFWTFVAAMAQMWYSNYKKQSK